jgi:hypothetical protein
MFISEYAFVSLTVPKPITQHSPIQHKALYSTSPIQHNSYTAQILCSTQPYTAHSPIQHKPYTAQALYSTNPIQHKSYTAHSPIQQTAIYSTIPIQHTALYSTQSYTTHSPIHHTAYNCSQIHPLHYILVHIIFFIWFVSLLTSSSATVNKFK